MMRAIMTRRAVPITPEKARALAKKFTLAYCEERLRADPEACALLYGQVQGLLLNGTVRARKTQKKTQKRLIA